MAEFKMLKFVFSILALAIAISPVFAETGQVIHVGVATVLTGDVAIIGSNVQKTVETYRRYHLRHPIEFIFEDARKNSSDGLAAYRKLIDSDRVQVLIGATTSNGTLAGAPVVNRSKTVLLTPLTGGSNIDKAGPYIFRIGNSDILNGFQQADLFLSRGLRNVALVTEQTEYTTDITKPGHRNSPAIYSKKLAFLKGIKMRGQNCYCS
jgi:branched-chain amino acid transport system substrate-binding protein